MKLETQKPNIFKMYGQSACWETFKIEIKLSDPDFAAVGIIVWFELFWLAAHRCCWYEMAALTWIHFKCIRNH